MSPCFHVALISCFTVGRTRFHPTKDTMMILDYDECLSDEENDCHVEASCMNTNGEGSYICECQGGFVGDGFHCEGMSVTFFVTRFVVVVVVAAVVVFV